MSAERIDPAKLLAHAAAVQRLARALTREPELAEDAAQQTLTVALESPQIESASLGPWLAGVARNWIAKTRRARQRRMDVEWKSAREHAQPSTQELVIRAELHRELMAAVLALEERQREAILLRYLENLAPREIAARLDVPVRTVNTRLARGLVRLREELDRNGGRERWLGAFLLLGGESSMLLPFGILAMKSKLIAAAVLVIALSWFGVRALIEREEPSASVPSVATAAPIETPRSEHEAALDARTVATAPASEAKPAIAEIERELKLSLVTSAGIPVPAAQLALFRGETLLATGATDAAGLAHFEAGEGSGEVFISAPNWAPARLAVELAAGKYTLTLADGAALGGRVFVFGTIPPEPIELVFEATAPPAALMSLPKQLRDSMGDVLLKHGLQYAITDANGAFFLRGLPADATGDLTWNEPWFLDRGETNAPETRSVAIPTLRTDVELRLTRGMELALRVVDQSGAPVLDVGVLVKILSQELRSIQQQSGKSDGEGRFRCSLGNKPPTGVEVRIHREDGSGAVTSKFDMPAGIRALWDIGDLALAATRTISVHVQDQDGAPIERALAVPLPSKAKTGGACSDANGDFEQTLGVDDTQLMAQAVGYESALVAVPPDATRVVATLMKACMLEFKIIGGDGVDLRFHMVSVSGALPLLTDEAPDSLPALQDPYGGRDNNDPRRPYRVSSFRPPPRLSGLVAGRALEAALVGYNGPPIAEAHIAPLAVGEHRVVELTVTRRPKTLRVHVLSPDFQPVVGAEVRMVDSVGNNGRTDGTGTFDMPWVNMDRFSVTVEAAGFPTKIVHGVSIPPEELTVLLEVSRTLEVELVQVDGSPFTGKAEVRAGHSDLSMIQGVQIGESRWRVSNLPAGEVVVWAGNASFRPVTQLHDTSMPSVRIVVGHSGYLIARVDGTAAFPKDGLWIALRAEGESRTQRRVQVQSSSQGGFIAASEGLAFGAYDVWLETRDPAPPCDWIRIGAPQKVVLDAEHERAEIEFDP